MPAAAVSSIVFEAQHCGAGDRATGTPTTILLSRTAAGWRATQRGVDVVGEGPTAPLAAADYCRLLGTREEATTDRDADWHAATAADAERSPGEDVAPLVEGPQES